MALIKCKECGQEISDMATACPKCGKPSTQSVGESTGQKSNTTVRPPLDIRQFSRNMENWCALVLLIAFFLPWMSQIGITVNGPGVLKAMATELTQVGGTGSGYYGDQIIGGYNLSFVAYLGYLIPLLSLVLVVNGLLGRKPLKLLMLIDGVVPLLLLTLCLVPHGDAVFSLIGIGGWVTLLAGIFLIIFVSADVGTRFSRKPE